VNVRRGGLVLPVVLVVVLLAALAGCSGDPTGAGPPTPGEPAVARGPHPLTVGARPFTLYVPDGYQTGTAAPLLVLLHGYTSSGGEQESYLKFATEAGRRGVLYVVPDGTADARNNRFWNATDACCNLYGSQVDDAAYLVDVIREVSAKYTVDSKRVYLFGHSNGAFMSYRMACDHADLIAGIAALNGAMWSDRSRCAPTRPVSVLHIRGTNDTTIANAGGAISGNTYPSTTQTVADWVTLDGCDPAPDPEPGTFDLETTIAGPETTVTRYPACRGGSRDELWSIKDAGHIPSFTPAFAPAVFDFLLAQSLT
jgi:polyhydroxybutyrate depolymerase